jgi:hypothetical protein
MLSRIFRLLLIAGLATSSLCASNDPFVGKWKVNRPKSKLNDEMKVEVAGANRYTFTFAPPVSLTRWSLTGAISPPSGAPLFPSRRRDPATGRSSAR